MVFEVDYTISWGIWKSFGGLLVVGNGERFHGTPVGKGEV